MAYWHLYLMNASTSYAFKIILSTSVATFSAMDLEHKITLRINDVKGFAINCTLSTYIQPPKDQHLVLLGLNLINHFSHSPISVAGF